MFAGTPYEHDALGTRPSFDKTTAAMLKDFHDKWYAPNNAIFVIVGDLDPEATLAKIKALFEDIPAKTLPARPEFNLEAGREHNRSRVPTDRSTSATVIALRMPGPKSPDFAALEVLADVLSSQRGALYSELVPTGKALGTDFEMDPLPKAGLAYATAAYPTVGRSGRDQEGADGHPRQYPRTRRAGRSGRGGQAAGKDPRRPAEGFDLGAGLGLVGGADRLWAQFAR